MAYNWLKWFHGAVTDDKWPLIARKSGQPVAVVVAVWAALLECASQAEDRGSVEDFDAESMDAVLQVADGACAAIVAALSAGKRPRIVDGRIANWEKRQDEPPQDPTGKERKRRQREREREKAEGGLSRQCHGECHNVTRDNVTSHGSERDKMPNDEPVTVDGVTSHADVTLSRTDKTRLDKNINTPPPMDIFNYQDARVAQSVPEGGEGEDYLEPAGVDENTPSIEFQEIRLAYNERGRSEAPQTGLKEYIALKKSRQWPGLTAILDGVERLAAEDEGWLSGKAPGLARFLAEQWWRMPARKARASPLAPPGQTVTDRNEATAMRVLAEMEAENGN